MAYGIVKTEELSDIADAIRAKLGVQTQYKPGQMADAIESIYGGGITPTGTKQITANGTYDVTEFASAEVAVPQSGITPTGTKQVSVTQNGTVTEDVSNYENVEINTNVVNQDYVDALTALGVQSDLANSITALTAYANGVTGAADTDLSDAVHTLGSGYGGGSVEEETGTYTATADGIPTINFANSHTKGPSIILFMKTDTSTSIPINCATFFAYTKVDDFFGVGLQTGLDIFRTGLYMQAHTQSNGNTQLGAGVAEATSQIVISSTGFKPYFSSSSFVCRAGNTYKWIAIWK